MKRSICTAICGRDAAPDCCKAECSVSRVYGVVTFYTFFYDDSKGKHPISVCMGTACYVRGSEKLLEEFKRVLGIEVGETTPDGKFSLDCLRCVGACGLAPVVMIGEKVYGRLQAVDVKKVLEELGSFGYKEAVADSLRKQLAIA